MSQTRKKTNYTFDFFPNEKFMKTKFILKVNYSISNIL